MTNRKGRVNLCTCPFRENKNKAEGKGFRASGGAHNEAFLFLYIVKKRRKNAEKNYNKTILPTFQRKTTKRITRVRSGKLKILKSLIPKSVIRKRNKTQYVNENI